MTITVANRQRAIRFDLRWLKNFARAAFNEVKQLSPVAKNAPLPWLDAVEISIITDAAIAEVHERFMQISGATDVITFEHGEILISADTAKKNAASYGQKLEEELGLYIIHGLLHLHGFDDQSAPDAARMRRVQTRILRTLLRGKNR